MAETIVRFHPQYGAALYDVERQCYVIDPETNEPIPADPRTGRAKVQTEPCPTCQGKGRVVKQ